MLMPLSFLSTSQRGKQGAMPPNCKHVELLSLLVTEIKKIKYQICCHQICSLKLKMHQTCFRRRPVRGTVWDTPFPFPPKRLRHLDLGASILAHSMKKSFPRHCPCSQIVPRPNRLAAELTCGRTEARPNSLSIIESFTDGRRS